MASGGGGGLFVRRVTSGNGTRARAYFPHALAFFSRVLIFGKTHGLIMGTPYASGINC